MEINDQILTDYGFEVHDINNTKFAIKFPLRLDMISEGVWIYNNKVAKSVAELNDLFVQSGFKEIDIEK